jgi:hypothetical protein
MAARIACWVFGSAMAVQGCNDLRTCTDAFCESGVSIVVGSAAPLPTGLYRVTVRLDGVETTCRRTLPDSNDPDMLCNPAGSAAFYFGDGSSPTAPGGMTQELHVAISGAPRRIELEIGHEVLGVTDERIVASESFTPEYVALAPNGEECGPVCENAELEAAPLVFD